MIVDKKNKAMMVICIDHFNDVTITKSGSIAQVKHMLRYAFAKDKEFREIMEEVMVGHHIN